jgi:hypothetical protein
VDHVCLPQLTEEQRPVTQLCNERSQVLDPKELIEWTRRHGIDRNNPRFDVRIVHPALYKAPCLDRMPAEDPQ